MDEEKNEGRYWFGSFVYSFVHYCGLGSILLWTPVLRPCSGPNSNCSVHVPGGVAVVVADRRRHGRAGRPSSLFMTPWASYLGLPDDLLLSADATVATPSGQFSFRKSISCCRKVTNFPVNITVVSSINR